MQDQCVIVIIATSYIYIYGNVDHRMVMTSRGGCSLDVNKLGKHETQRWWSVDDERMPTLL